jgi:hypothetical protein
MPSVRQKKPTQRKQKNVLKMFELLKKSNVRLQNEQKT